MTPDDFHRIALELPETEEGRHDGHPTFRVCGKRFATLGWPDAESASLHLSPEEQEMLMTAVPSGFRPVPGGLGRRGHTIASLRDLDEATLRSALQRAWRRAAPMRLS